MQRIFFADPNDTYIWEKLILFFSVCVIGYHTHTILTMSAFDIIKRPIDEIKAVLTTHGASLRTTEFPDTYLIKFTEETKVSDPEINQLKGLIFNHKTGQVISMSYPVPVEVKDLSEDHQLQLVRDLDSLLVKPEETKSEETKSSITVQECPDGSLLRLSFMDDRKEWILSSNSRELAKSAFWMNGISLEDQFKSTKDYPAIKFDELNKDYVYLFVMCHQLNVIVVNHTESRLYHVATYDRRSLCEIDTDIGIQKPKVYQMTIAEVRQATREAHGKPVESAGYMVLHRRNGLVLRYRFENENYTHARLLRGNSNNLEFTLISLAGLKLDESKELKEFLQYYPMYQSNWSQLLDRIGKLVSKLYRDYCVRHKEGRYWVVHHRHHYFIEELHEKVYKLALRPAGYTVKYDDVLNYLVRQPTAKILWMLNYIFDRSPSRAPRSRRE